MKNILFVSLLLLMGVIMLVSCNKKETALEILEKTINTIDTIETIYYKQDMSRTNPKNISDTIFRYREMYFQRLIEDSIVGVKGHWYMYIDDKSNVVYEDIYDGSKLIRKNNADSVARVYDLVKSPGFRDYHFWSHNTLYGMQYEFKHILLNTDAYSVERLSDTIIAGESCFQLRILLENQVTMPGFATRLEESEGSMSTTFYFINKESYYPISIKGESYDLDSPDRRFFMEQRYYDIRFNLMIDEAEQFNTSPKSLMGYERIDMNPQ